MSNFGGTINSPGGILTASVTLTPAQLRTPGLQVTLVPAVAGKTIVVLGTVFRLNSATVAWTGAGSDIGVENRNADIVWSDFTAFFQNLTGSRVRYQSSANPSAGNPNTALASSIEGSDLVAFVGVAGSPAGADGSITISVAYYLA